MKKKIKLFLILFILFIDGDSFFVLPDKIYSWNIINYTLL